MKSGVSGAWATLLANGWCRQVAKPVLGRAACSSGMHVVGDGRAA